MYLGPEMKSTGEILGMDESFKNAIYKGFMAAGYKIPDKKRLYVSIADIHKKEALEVVKEYVDRGFELFASAGTSDFILSNASIKHNVLTENEIMNYIFDGKIGAAINIPTKGNSLGTFGFKLRRKLSEHRVPMFTSIDTARLFLDAMDVSSDADSLEFKTLTEYINIV